MSRVVIPGPMAEVSIDDCDQHLELEILVENVGYSGVITNRQAAEVVEQLLEKPAVQAAYIDLADREAASHATKGTR
jgi:hypothetical protein